MSTIPSYNAKELEVYNKPNSFLKATTNLCQSGNPQNGISQISHIHNNQYTPQVPKLNTMQVKNMHIDRQNPTSHTDYINETHYINNDLQPPVGNNEYRVTIENCGN